MEDGLGKTECERSVHCWNVQSRHFIEREGSGDEKRGPLGKTFQC